MSARGRVLVLAGKPGGGLDVAGLAASLAAREIDCRVVGGVDEARKAIAGEAGSRVLVGAGGGALTALALLGEGGAVVAGVALGLPARVGVLRRVLLLRERLRLGSDMPSRVMAGKAAAGARPTVGDWLALAGMERDAAAAVDKLPRDLALLLWDEAGEEGAAAALAGRLRDHGSGQVEIRRRGDEALVEWCAARLA